MRPHDSYPVNGYPTPAGCPSSASRVPGAGGAHHSLRGICLRIPQFPCCVPMGGVCNLDSLSGVPDAGNGVRRSGAQGPPIIAGEGFGFYSMARAGAVRNVLESVSVDELAADLKISSTCRPSLGQNGTMKNSRWCKGELWTRWAEQASVRCWR